MEIHHEQCKHDSCLNFDIMLVTFIESWAHRPTTHYQCKTFEFTTEQVKRQITTKCSNTKLS